MFYSVDLLRMRKSRKGRLPKCWLAGTIKDFIGIGFHKLSKTEVECVYVEAACDDILDGIIGKESSNRFSLYLSSQLAFGALKIFQKQVSNLGDGCEKLYKNIITNSIISTKKNSRQKKIEKNIDLSIDTEVEALDLTCLFSEKEVDKHLIDDDIPMLIEMGLEFHDIVNNIDEIRRRFPTSPTLLEMFSNNHFEISNARASNNQEKITDPLLQKESTSISVTPKRKYDKSHNETPKKRTRRLLVSTTNPSELARSPTTSIEVRRSIFKNHEISLIMNADPGTSGCIPMDEDAAESFSTVEPVGQLRSATRYSPSRWSTEEMPLRLQISINESLEPPRISDESFVALKTHEETVIGLQINKDIFDLLTPQNNAIATTHRYSKMIHSPQTLSVQKLQTDDRLQNKNNKKKIARRNLQNDFQLEELNEELMKVLNSQDQKSKKSRVFDRVKQINLKEPEGYLHCTRSLISTQPKINGKVLAKLLLVLPSKGLKIGASLNRNLCSWAGVLQDLYFKRIQTPCSNVLEIYREPKSRDGNLNRKTRLSEFIRGSSSILSTSQYTSSKSVLNSTIGQNNENEITDPDMILMPPPLPVPEPPLEVQIDEEERQQQHMPLRTQPSSDFSDLRMARSPEQISEYSDDVQQNDNTSMYCTGTMESQLSDLDDSFLPKLQCSQSNILVSSSSDSENELQLENLIMTKEGFYELLEEMWLIAENYLIDEEELLKFEFDDILTPGDASIEELIKYFLYCCELEKKHKLYLKQDIPFGSVCIIKVESVEKDINVLLS